MASGLVWLWPFFSCSPIHRIPAPEPPPAVLPPTVARAQYLRGQLMAASGDLEGAEHALARARIFDANEPRILMALGSIQMTRGDVNAARTYYAKAVEVDPHHADAWFDHGRVEMAFGDKELGRIALRKTLSLDGSWVARAMLISDALRVDGHTTFPSDLAWWTEQALTDPQQLRSRGELRLLAGDPSGAVDDLLGALNRDRHDESLVASLVRAATISRRISTVLMDADAVVRQDPTAKAYWLLLGRLSALIGDHQQTTFGLDGAVLLGVDLTEADQSILSSAQQAIEAVELPSEAQHEFPDTQLGRALMWLEERRWDEAEHAVQQALAENPKDVQMLYVLAQINLERDGPEASIPSVENLVTVAPDFTPGLNLWAWVHAENDVQLGRAEAYARRALRRQPHLGAYWDTLGWVLMRQGRLDDALPILERAVRLSPNDDAVRARRDSCRATVGGAHQ